MKGRKPTPPRLKLLQGNKGCYPVFPEVAAPMLDTVPEAPKFLSAWARDEWNRVAPDLHVRGLLSAFDVLPLAAYCSCAGRLVEAEEALADLRRAGVDCIWVSPLIKVVERAAADVAKLGAEYGLTPTGRVRLAGAGTPPRPKSKFAGLISGH